LTELVLLLLLQLLMPLAQLLMLLEQLLMALTAVEAALQLTVPDPQMALLLQLLLAEDLQEKFVKQEMEKLERKQND
jgi:hypothetical protein